MPADDPDPLQMLKGLAVESAAAIANIVAQISTEQFGEAVRLEVVPKIRTGSLEWILR